MSENEKVRIVREIVAAWNAHDAKNAFSFFTRDATDDDTTQPQKFSGPACANYWQEFFNAFPDVTFTVKNIVAGGNHVVVESMFSGTQKRPFEAWTTTWQEGRRFEVRAVFIFRFKNNKVGEITEYYDRATIIRQLEI